MIDVNIRGVTRFSPSSTPGACRAPACATEMSWSNALMARWCLPLIRDWPNKCKPSLPKMFMNEAMQTRRGPRCSPYQQVCH